MKTLAEVTAAAGRARMAKLSPEERRELGRKGGRARWAKATAADRELAARKMVEGQRRGKAQGEGQCRVEERA